MRRWFSVWTEFPVSFRTIFGFSSIIIITVYYLFGHIDFFLFTSYQPIYLNIITRVYSIYWYSFSYY
jgi:hypothetical protein